MSNKVTENLKKMLDAVEKMTPEEVAERYEAVSKNIKPEDYKPYAKLEKYIVGKEIKGYGEAPRYLTKDCLKDLTYYMGECRNSEYAIWSEKLSVFIYKRSGNFEGDYFIETIKHPQDDDGADLFFPFRRVEDYKEIPEKSKVSIKEILKLQGDCPYFFFDHDTMKEVTPEMIQLVEDSFPTRAYGDDILWYEGWPLRDILQQAMVMGAWLERNKKK